MRQILSFRSFAAFACVLTVQASTVAAQDAPPRRAHHSLVYDDAGGRILLAGGSTLGADRRYTFYDDLWSFDGANWKALPRSGPQQSGQRMAYDAGRRQVFSFGGFRGTQSLDHLLRLDDDSWQTIGALAGRPVSEGGFVYDIRRNRLVAFGGSAGRNQAHGDTWEFDGAQWTRTASDGPAPRQGFAMVYDSARGVTVLYGGMGPNGELYGDTWTYDGRAWTEQRVSGPPARGGPGFAYDARRGQFLIFGGMTSSGFVGDTWGWDGTRWQQLATRGPAPRLMGHMAYDKRRDRTVLFGGRPDSSDVDLRDTWEWDGSAWREWSPPAPGASTPFTVKGGNFFALSVADLQESVRWYTEKFGLAVKMEIPKTGEFGIAVLEGGGLTIELLQHDNAAPLQQPANALRDRSLLHGLFKVGFVVEDFDATIAALRARGVTIAYGPFPARADQRANAIILDNGGNMIQIAGEYAR